MLAVFVISYRISHQSFGSRLPPRLSPSIICVCMNVYVNHFDALEMLSIQMSMLIHPKRNVQMLDLIQKLTSNPNASTSINQFQNKLTGFVFCFDFICVHLCHIQVWPIRTKCSWIARSLAKAFLSKDFSQHHAIAYHRNVQHVRHTHMYRQPHPKWTYHVKIVEKNVADWKLASNRCSIHGIEWVHAVQRQIHWAQMHQVII